MFDDLTVAENIFMGHMPGGALIDWRTTRARAADTAGSASRRISARTRR